MTRAWARTLASVLLSSAALPAAADSPAPARLCTAPLSKVDAAICQDESLATLDRQLSTSYGAAVTKALPVRTPETLEAEQRGFVQQRDACLRQRDLTGCLRGIYFRRVSELQAIHGLVPVTGRARFACEGEGPQAIEAVFFASEAPSALLRAGDREVLVFQYPSASGAQYEGDGVMFWNKGDEAQVSWEEIELRCRVAQ
jgi:uncharacterized protein